MSNIKFPSDKEIEKQIAMIIDSSGMFDDEENNETYVECTPIRRGSPRKTIGMWACAAAICLVLGMVVMPSIKNNRASIEPLGTQKSGDGLTQQDEINIRFYTNVGTYANAVQNSKISIGYTHVVAEVQRNGETLDWINRQNLIYERMNEARIFYNDIDSDGKNVMDVDNIKEKLIQYSAQPTPEVSEAASKADNYKEIINENLNKDSVSTYNSNSELEISKAASKAASEVDKYKEIINEQLAGSSNNKTNLHLNVIYKDFFSKGISDKNRNVISLMSTCEDEFILQQAGSSISYTTRVRSFGENYDLTLKRALTYKDIFSDYDTAIDIIVDSVCYNGGMNYGGIESGLNGNQAAKEATKKKIEQENNWCFTENGIMIFLNDNEIKAASETETGLEKYSCTTVTVKFTELLGIKDEYRN